MKILYILLAFVTLNPEVERPIEGLFFKVDSSNFQIFSTDTLVSLIGYLLSYRDMKVLLTGHCDSLGTEEYNMKLSFKRADSVKAFLTSLGVKPENIETSGKGESEPIADNGTQEGRDKNRRVEYKLLGNPEYMFVKDSWNTTVLDFEGMNDLTDSITLPYRTFLTEFDGYTHFVWKEDTIVLGNEGVVAFYVEDGRLNILLQKGYIYFSSSNKDLALDIGNDVIPLSERGSIFKDENVFTISNFKGDLTYGDVIVPYGSGYSICDKRVYPLPTFAGLIKPRDGAKFSFKNLKSSFGLEFNFGENGNSSYYHLVIREGDKVLRDIITSKNNAFFLLAPGEYNYTSSIIDEKGNESPPESGSISIGI